jgi:ABC-type polysaccharide/polyol phosphate export permease
MTQSEITVNSFWDWGTSLLTSNAAVLFCLACGIGSYAVLFKDFSLLTTFASGLAWHCTPVWSYVCAGGFGFGKRPEGTGLELCN